MVRLGARLLASLGALGPALWATSAYASHETRFSGSGEDALNPFIIAATVVVALLCFGLVTGALILWERYDAEASRRVQDRAEEEMRRASQ